MATTTTIKQKPEREHFFLMKNIYTRIYKEKKFHSNVYIQLPIHSNWKWESENYTQSHIFIEKLAKEKPRNINFHTEITVCNHQTEKFMENWENLSMQSSAQKSSLFLSFECKQKQNKCIMNLICKYIFQLGHLPALINYNNCFFLLYHKKKTKSIQIDIDLLQ